MTDNQERAKEYLQQPYEARLKFEQLTQEADELRNRAENVKSAQHVELGDTGRTITDKRGRKQAVMAPILMSSASTGNERQELAHCLLADATTKCEDQFRVYVEIDAEVRETINGLVEDATKRVILRRRHLSVARVSFEDIAQLINYSKAHTRQLYYDALEELGAKL